MGSRPGIGWPIGSRTCTTQLRVVIYKTPSLFQPGSRTILETFCRSKIRCSFRSTTTGPNLGCCAKFGCALLLHSEVSVCGCGHQCGHQTQPKRPFVFFKTAVSMDSCDGCDIWALCSLWRMTMVTWMMMICWCSPPWWNSHRLVASCGLIFLSIAGTRTPYGATTRRR